MRIALIDTNKRPKWYPVSLLKIGTWRKSLGDECVLFENRLPSAGEFDAIWLTTTFTYDLKHSLGMACEALTRAPDVLVGGVAATLIPEAFEKRGVRVHRGLLAEAEPMAPDYSLLPEPPTYSITHTSRGCVRSCQWCMVPMLEGSFRNRPDWTDDLASEAKAIVFYDNNWLAKKLADMRRDVDTLRALVEDKEIDRIDFNQGLDPRLLTEKKADLLKGLPIDPIRFAFDGMHEDGHFQTAIRRMFKRGHTKFWNLALYNFKDTPADTYYRMKECAKLADELGNTSIRISICPMRYHPIAEAHLRRDYVGINWTKQKRNAFARILSAHNPRAAISCTGSGTLGWDAVDEFDFWFGRDTDAFEKLLTYPRLTDLLKRKRVDLRMRRAKEKGKTS